MTVFGSAGSPTVKERMVSTIAFLTALSWLFGTRRRVPAAQACPLFIKAMTRQRRLLWEGVYCSPK